MQPQQKAEKGGNGDDTRESLSMRIVTELASAVGCAPTELDPLADSVSPDALEELVTTGNNVTVEFDHAGHTVRVEPDSTVHVTPE